MPSVFRAAIVALLVVFLAPLASAQWNGSNPLWTSSRVGIGTSTPDPNFGLDVSGSSYGININTSCCGFVFFKKSGDLYGWLSHNTNPNRLALAAGTAKALGLGANGMETHLLIDTTGNVSVGPVSSARFSVSASEATPVALSAMNVRTSGGLSYYAGNFMSAQGSTNAISRLVGFNINNYRVDASATGLVTNSVALEVSSLSDSVYGVNATNNYGILIGNMNNVTPRTTTHSCTTTPHFHS